MLAALTCHGELARRKPSPQNATIFYLWLAVGGALGGLFTTLAAPLLFHTMLEYPGLAACACIFHLQPYRPAPVSRRLWLAFGVSVGAAFGLFPLTYLTQHRALILASGIGSLLAFSAIGGALSFRLLRTPRRITFAFGSFALIVMWLLNTRQPILLQDRNFFGTLKVAVADGMHLFYHGTTLHGAQYQDAAQRHAALTYFHQDGPFGQLLRALPADATRAMAVLGLGIGTMASYARAGDALTFYELDPQVVAVAANPQLFRYLADCRGTVRIVTGDGRLALAHAPDQAYSLMVQDAFSSDTIPVHLLTREAFRLYARKLTADGVLIFNVTNRYLDVAPVVAGLLHDQGLRGFIRRDRAVSVAQQAQGHYPSVWIAAARAAQTERLIQALPGWQPLPVATARALWTDEYSNILSVLKLW